MDLELFLADLTSRFDAERRADLDVLVGDLTDAERAGVSLAARLVASEGTGLTLLLRGGTRVSGTVADVAREWVLLRGGTGSSLVPVTAIAAVWPLGGAAADEGSLAHAVGIGHVLRELGEAEVDVLVDHDAGTHHGLVAAVFADHVDLESSPGPRPADARDRGVGTRITLPLSGLRRVRVWEEV